MDREKKVFLCVKSLLNISKDLTNEYKEYTDMLLFIADKIAEAEQHREKKKDFTLHGDGKVHDLSCGEAECDFVLPDDPKYSEEMKIEKEIDEMISVVKKEMSSVSD